MKKLAIILAFAILPYVSIAQSNFDKYEDMKGVSSVVVTSKMFKLLSQIKLESNDAEVQEYMNLVENIKKHQGLCYRKCSSRTKDEIRCK